MSVVQKRAKVPTVLQMEALECGAAALTMILAYYGKILPLEEVRIECGVSRDGSKASNILKVARKYGMKAWGSRKEPEALRTIRFPAIIHWNFCHFVVLEGFGKGKVYLNDPASGSCIVTDEEFNQSFTGIVLHIELGPDFVKSGSKPSLINSLKPRLAASKQAMVFIALIALFLVIPGLVLPTFTRIFIDDILTNGRQGWLMPVLVGMGITVLSQGLLTWLREWCLTRWEAKLAIASSAKFFGHIIKLPMEFFAQRYAGEIGSRVQINDKVATLISGSLATAVIDVLVVAFFLLLLVQYNAVLTAVGLLVAMINMAYLRYVANWRTEQNKKLLQDRGKLGAFSMGGLQIIETIKAGGNENDFFAKWSGHQAKLMNSEMRFALSGQFMAAVPVFLTTLNTAIILAVGGFQVMDGQMTVGMLMAFQALMANFIEPFNRLVNLGGALQETEGDLNRLDDVLRYPAETGAAALPLADEDACSAKLEGYLELKNVSFGYSRLEPPLIENFNLTIKPGARVALVGGSGSGKSTVAKLVSGLYQPWAGEILFDGQLRSQINRAVVSNSVAVVDQDICLYEGTVRDNLTLWNTDIPDMDIVQAAKDAAIGADIAALSGGYDAKIDEGGRNFSGGQRQRLEIARALAVNPTVLVLDEATSALDPLTEKQVDEGIRRRGCTCLIVAHRLSTIRDCDEIIVMSAGKVVERGTHEQLYSSDGLYRQLIGTNEPSGKSSAKADG
ncbi:NHLP family bacteriocin export ABC transporter peptidase/permease/ATPase subunit [Sporomusa malonica]|uniref:NHLM bacteriocin system ABC transporter, peptidase/ATP-binding protein n=1 Tax=Sporomusa malonica TaxID=112901 RepID=A0A1W2CY00_9FIRM|nr:NHLP family bacteriocin export ABC transporter peptidase/permease/ATPase subunit [Sporomusa malonica]SMC90135.1 NHLM bacteriocin system ABC transporter, peptidase/ATP-binding protein [Sporomusa malonica]